ncbi:DUF2961 domain-containing protein [Puteibacter caeruleilacunae]|nr:DUF2961 domain-containing protein [Puteibacter caeruleilacunae]
MNKPIGMTQKMKNVELVSKQYFIKRVTMKCVFTLLTVIVLAPSLVVAQKNTHVTIQSLLKEMVTRESIAKLPVPAYKNLQASSYDRRTVSYDQGWHANGDRSYFVRVEEKGNGRFEHVLLDTKGPGAIVRFWSVTSNIDLLGGTLRFYIDGDSEPVFSGTLEKLIGGDYFSPEPLSITLAKESVKYKQGRNLYLPIPFSKSIKVTYEKQDGKKLTEGEAAWPNDAVFYNINYRLYEKSARVESLSPKLLVSAKELIELTNKKLLDDDVVSRRSVVKDFKGKILPQDSKVLEFKAPSRKGGAINQVLLKVEAENLPQALRSTVLEITFDGERTVWVPVGDFFGTGYQIRSSKHWYGSVDESGLMRCSWIMPFAETCRVKISNLGNQDVNVSVGELSLIKWDWNDRSMHFGAAWHQFTNINSKPDRDLNYVTLEGEGVYVGDALTLFDISPQWWGEGDEKIFVDNDSFPSHFGTGSEDYYGYAWCMKAPFSSPFVTQPDGSGNESVGFTVNCRYRLLDGIPFSKKLHFDMELMHWQKSRLNYAPTVYWYARPGISCNIDPSPEAAKYPVALTPDDVK